MSAKASRLAAKYAGALIALLIASMIAAYAALYLTRGREAVIGFIDISGYIIYEEDRTAYLKMIECAIRNDTIRAVVVRVRSPGGYVTMVEDVYRALRLLSSKKPTVAVIQDIAASGGYYVAMAADWVVAEPTSLIGNIGVILIVPPRSKPSEAVVESGPYKLTGFPLTELYGVARGALRNFLSAIKESRGDRLRVSLEELSLGKLYLGSEAKEMGLIDELGTVNDAMERVVKQLHLTKYKVVPLSKVVRGLKEEWPGASVWLSRRKVSEAELLSAASGAVPLYYLSPLYVNITSQVVVKIPGPSRTVISSTQLGVEGSVLIDMSHKNNFLIDEVGTLLSEIVKGGLKVRFVGNRGEFVSAVERRPKALVIINPCEGYTTDEIKAVLEFVERGGKLILIYDPLRAPARHVNLIAMEFGFVFFGGLLYDMRENFGVPRNVVVRSFNSSHALAENLTELVLLGATHVASEGAAVAFTSNTTMLSASERCGVYTPIAASSGVVAIGDFTFLSDPYCHLADNKAFIDRLVSFIKKSSHKK